MEGFPAWTGPQRRRQEGRGLHGAEGDEALEGAAHVTAASFRGPCGAPVAGGADLLLWMHADARHRREAVADQLLPALCKVGCAAFDADVAAADVIDGDSVGSCNSRHECSQDFLGSACGKECKGTRLRVVRWAVQGSGSKGYEDTSE